VKELEVDGGGGAGGKAKERAGTKEGWEEGKEEVEAQLRGSAEEIIREEGPPGSFGDYADGDALKIPKGVERGAGDIVPDTLLPRIRRFVEGGVGADGGVLSLAIASSALIDAERLWPGGRGSIDLPEWTAREAEGIYLSGAMNVSMVATTAVSGNEGRTTMEIGAGESRCADHGFAAAAGAGGCG
jgi:hypothetical protein